MSQDIFPNINPATTSGNQLATLLNGFKDAVASGFSGVTRPPNLQAGGYWIDTSLEASPDFLWRLKIWTGTSDLTLFTLNISTEVISVGGAGDSFSITKTSADAVGPILDMIKKRILNNGQTLVGDSLGDIDFKSTDNAGAQIISARVRVVSNNNTTPSLSGAYITWEAINTGSAALLEKMRLTEGLLGVGTTTPVYKVHAKGAEGIGVEVEADSTAAAKVTMRKKRVSLSGKVLSGDGIGSVLANSTDNAGTEVAAFAVDVTATEDHTSTAHGTKASVKVKKIGQTSFTEKVSIGDVLNFPDGSQTKDVIVGSHATPATNAKIKRSAVGKMTAVLGDDASAEGSEPTAALAQMGFVFENFTDATKPTNLVANKGRIIYVSDLGKHQYDDGSDWVDLTSGIGNWTVNKFTGNDSQTDFTLTVDPGSENNVFVFKSGTRQETDTYSVTGLTLSFATAPESNVDDPENIEVLIGGTVSIGTPSDATVTTAKIVDLNVTTAKINDSAVTTAKIANDAVTFSKILDSIITIAKAAIKTVSSSPGLNGVAVSSSCGTFTTTSSSPGLVTNLSVTLVTKGNPVEVWLESVGTTAKTGYWGQSGGNEVYGYIKRDGTVISQMSMAIGSGTLEIPVSSVYKLDTGASAASHVYTFEMAVSSGTGTMKEARLCAKETW